VHSIAPEGGKQVAVPVNLGTAMAEGAYRVYRIQGGDVIYVPGTSVETSGGANVAYVVGDVPRPGAYAVGSGIDLLKVVASPEHDPTARSRT